MGKLTIIGDVHGRYEEYLEIASQADYSIQLGDFGFDFKCLDSLDPVRHRVVMGNHDNYGVPRPWHLLDSFGPVIIGGMDFFYIRGAYSIDVMHRTPNVNWWADEQLNTKQGQDCVELFAQSKPEFVLSHDCPLTVYGLLLGQKPFRESWTARILEECFSRHQPQYWYFGHHHRTWTEKVGKTRFRCLRELEVSEWKV